MRSAKKIGNKTAFDDFLLFKAVLTVWTSPVRTEGAAIASVPGFDAKGYRLAKCW